MMWVVVMLLVGSILGVLLGEISLIIGDELTFRQMRRRGEHYGGEW